MSQLTIPDIAPEIEYAISSSTTGPFVVPFPFFAEADVLAKHTAADGTETDLVITTDFTFTDKTEVVDNEGVGWSAGEITLNSAISDGSLNIYRSVTIDRLANYPTTGPIRIAILNDELNKVVAIMQELKRDKDLYLSLPEGSVDSTPFDAAARPIGNIGETSDGASVATNRQVDANGPNWLEDNDVEAAIGSYDQWNTVFQASSIVIEGNDTTKLFDLLTEFFGFIQNRNAAEASFYVRYRYQVDCYSQVTKIANSSYPVKVGATAAIPFSFMDIAQDIDYSNGNCTVTVGIDFFPMGASSNDLYIQWGNLSVNTSEPR